MERFYDARWQTIWNLSDNWTNRVVPTAGGTAIFDAISGSNSRNVSVDSDDAVGTLNFTSNSSAYSFGPVYNNAPPMPPTEFAIRGSAPQIISDSTNQQTFNLKVAMDGSTSAAVISQTGSGSLNFQQGLTSDVNLNIVNSGTGSISVAGGIDLTATATTLSITGNDVSVTGAINAANVNVTGQNVNIANLNTVSGNLTGNGTYDSAVTIQSGATLSPGLNAPTAGGVIDQSFNGGLTFANNSNFAWSLDGTNFDVVNAESLTIGADWNTTLSLTESFNSAVSQVWNVFTGVNTFNLDSSLGDEASFLSSVTINGPAELAGLGNNFNWSFSGGNVSLNFTAVPEPSSMALLGIAGLVGGVVARRRAAKKSDNASNVAVVS